jgi:hypothetical protein
VGKNPHKWLNHAGLRVFQKWAKSGHRVGKVGKKLTKTSLQPLQIFHNIFQKTHFAHFHGHFAHFLPTFKIKSGQRIFIKNHSKSAKIKRRS